ncbi:hypothetical protein C9J85_14395 [Haloferax sp. wsp5]|nr:hypothetical protein C9J85_14395 [Haloferax sp. wsp5]
MGEIVATDETVTARALERVESAITDGTVGEPHRRTRVELLSYPDARGWYRSSTSTSAPGRRTAEAEAADDQFTENCDDDRAEIDSARDTGPNRTLGEFDLQALSATLATGTASRLARISTWRPTSGAFLTAGQRPLTDERGLESPPRN